MTMSDSLRIELDIARAVAARELTSPTEFQNSKQMTTEHDVILALARGFLPSPTTYMDSEFFTIRISGTGCRYRSQHAEYVWRDPDLWLSPEMLTRCVGLPVIIGHPAEGVLDSKEFLQRVIGIAVHTFVLDDELWGVMRVLDRDAAAELTDGEYDSSPAVVLSSDENVVLDVDGEKLLVEGRPSLIDHVAICRRGVWTAPGQNPGVEITQAA